MGAAYTPGLRVTSSAVVEKARRLPLHGHVLVKEGDVVHSEQVVARTELPGKVFSLNVAGPLGLLEADVPAAMKKRVGDRVAKDEVLAESPGIWGFFKSQVRSPLDAFVDAVSDKTGRVLLREAPIPVEVRAYIDGTVIETLQGEGCVVQARAALCQGIFGLGGEVEGELVIVADGEQPLTPAHFSSAVRGKVAVGGSLLTLEAFEAARAHGAIAVVTGGIHYRDVTRMLGHELGVAITGNETLGLTVVVTEGFGQMRMATATHALLSSLTGKRASVNGATQIRAGVIRPEVIVTDIGAGGTDVTRESNELMIGSRIRIIRTPHFGALAKVVELPVEQRQMPSETSVRVLVAELPSGERVTLPRANVEVVSE